NSGISITQIRISFWIWSTSTETGYLRYDVELVRLSGVEFGGLDARQPCPQRSLRSRRSPCRRLQTRPRRRRRLPRDGGVRRRAQGDCAAQAPDITGVPGVSSQNDCPVRPCGPSPLRGRAAAHSKSSPRCAWVSDDAARTCEAISRFSFSVSIAF